MSKKISLCMIVGNVEEYIERCLESFKPIADEICVVRAIGNQKADRTLDIARDNFGARTSEYLNKRAHLSWPHLDDFAAARQKSFDMSEGEYCFWCDSDDVLESGVNEVRELAERGGYAAFVFPYRIFGRGMVVPRERMMVKTSGEWRYPVHEFFDFHIKPVQAVEDTRVVVKHLPNLDKSGSNERNLRILQSIPEQELTTGLLYHLHLELALKGDNDGSVEAAKRVLARQDLGRPEKFELFLNLAQISKDPSQKEVLLHEAHRADPRRRESLGLLATNAMNYQQNEVALAYARQMMALPPPKSTDWNDRAAAYTWVGEDILAQAYRANGMMIEAEAVRQDGYRKRGNPRIALIHATRGRPEQAAKCRKIWLDMAEKPELVEHIFIFDNDDEESLPLSRMHHLKIPAGGGCVAAWNSGAFATQAPVLVQMSDDWTPLPRWDELILERIGDLSKPSVLAISDGFRKDSLLCMAIMTRSYFALDSFMFHPGFTGVYSDNWFTQLAYARKCVIEARDIVFTHDHPAKTGKPLDETYVRQNASERYEEGRKQWEFLQTGKDWSSVPGFFNFFSFYKIIADRLKDGDTAVELGVWLGKSIIFLAQELKRQNKKVRLIAVDHFKGESNQFEHRATVELCGGNVRGAFEKNMKRCGVDDMIEIVESESVAASKLISDESLSFCFIDASHDYESVKADVTAWRTKVRPGGILAGHDADWHEVAKAVSELIPDALVSGSLWVKNI